MRHDTREPPSLLADRYAIQRRIGRGGMATVYLAHDRKHDRDVAVKILHADLTESLGADRFLREIGIAARLTHPNILPLYDSGEVAGMLYYVMPFVAGESLRDHLSRQRQLSLEEAVRIGCEAAAALDHAHRQGIVHRDIKPENILLADGHAVLADFGIARAIDHAQQARLTVTGLQVGTPHYMSPEQSSGEAGLDGRTDIYALGCVLYEMLAGEPPFTGPTAQSIIAKRLAGPVPRVRAVRPAVPTQLETVLLRALDPVPADRYATAEQFRAALAACPVDEASRYLGQLGTARGRSRRRRTRALTAIAAAVTLAIASWLATRTRAGSMPELRTLAVLPITNVSGDAEQTYLADGLTDAVIGDLMRVPGLRVTSRASVMRYATAGMSMNVPGMGGSGASANSADMPTGPTKSLSEIAEELKVDLVMQASLARSGDSIRVAASLIQPATRQRIWNTEHVRHVRDVFALQQDLVAGVTGVVARGAEGNRIAKGQPSHDPLAHDAFLKGAYYQAHWKLPQAIEAFQRAVDIDPAHAPAHAGLSRAYYFMAFFGDLPPAIALGSMRRAANAALAQDSLLSEAHGQMALVKMLQEWDWDGAERHFERALELSPSHAQVHHDYAHFLLARGRQRESLEMTARAVALDPVNPMLISCLGWHSLFDSRTAEAIAYAAEAYAMMPDQWAQVVRGWALLGQNKPDSALQAFREATRLSASAFNQAALGYALAVTDRTAEARQVLAALLARADHEYVSAYDIATVYAGLGDRDETFKWLRRAAEERSTFFVHLGWDLRFAKVQDDQRYRRLLEGELGLRAPTRVVAAVGS